MSGETGCLSVLQGACAKSHRRMNEICGGRESARRTASVVIQSRASWRAVQRVAKPASATAPGGTGLSVGGLACDAL